jgi:DeoR family fructose operon transcriptional repressor
MLQRESAVPVGDISKFLGVSEATVRRDLNDLSRAGRLSRVYGGAVVHPDVEPSFAEVAVTDLADKEAIARRAAELVNDGDVVLLDIGTTTLLIARQLRGRPVTIITSNLAVYEELRDDPTVTLVLLGGVVRQNYRSLVGFLTELALRQLHADRLFLGASGVRPDGQVMDSTMVEVPVKQAMIAAADQVLLAVTAAKFPGTGVARVCGPAEVDIVITNSSSDAATLDALREASVEVVQA